MLLDALLDAGLLLRVQKTLLKASYAHIEASYYIILYLVSTKKSVSYAETSNLVSSSIAVLIKENYNVGYCGKKRSM
jgi:hypothetical protein